MRSTTRVSVGHLFPARQKRMLPIMGAAMEHSDSKTQHGCVLTEVVLLTSHLCCIERLVPGNLSLVCNQKV
eukprot:5296092-Amphidinium_carterae.1